MKTKNRRILRWKSLLCVFITFYRQNHLNQIFDPSKYRNFEFIKTFLFFVKFFLTHWNSIIIFNHHVGSWSYQISMFSFVKITMLNKSIRFWPVLTIPILDENRLNNSWYTLFIDIEINIYVRIFIDGAIDVWRERYV